MSEDLNRVLLVGRLVRDIELTHTQSGTALGKLSIAVNRRVKKDGNWIDEAGFYDAVQWGKRAEALAPYLLKGQQVAIDGSLKQDRWEKDGVKRSKVVIELDNIQLVGSNNGDRQPVKPAQNNGNQQYSNAPNDEIFEDDIPF